MSTTAPCRSSRSRSRKTRTTWCASRPSRAVWESRHRRDVHWFIATQVAQKVELLRQKQRAQLVKSLKGVDVFPDYPICDSALLPMMSNQVRRTCASFPAQARELVLKNGVEFETFQALLDKAERNPMYRWKLARAVRKLKRRQRAALEARKV